MIRRGVLGLFFAIGMQAAGPGGPVPGWTLDNRTATIRAVTGIPGAMRLADPITLPNGIAAVEFSSTGDFALAISTDQPAHLLAISAMHTAPAVVDLGAISDGSRILGLNQKGTAGLVYSPLIQSVLFVSALDQAPAISAPVSTAGLAGPITAGLLEDSGNCAVLGTGSIETLCADGSSRRVTQDTGLSVTALALANGSQDLWIADSANKQISRVSGYAQQSSATVFAAQTDGLMRPVALAVTSSGEVLAADADAQAVFTIDPASVSIQTISLSFVPSQLRPLTDRSLLLLNDLNSLPFTLFASEGMRTYFIPAN